MASIKPNDSLVEMNLVRGTLLHNRYRIIDVLGEGGMGAVYRAVDENLGVEVAVKENFFTSEDYTRQFHREATILASLRHPTLPRVTDHFSIEDQGQYLVMDFIEGEDLRERMDRVGLLSEEDVIVLGVNICDALTYMHSRTQPVLHRDIKPGNVKITPVGDIVLVDFGLAKIIDGDSETTPGARAMTPGYSPPEQYGTARTDSRSDIYSLGATLYEALTGSVPEDALSRLMEQASLSPIRNLNSEVSRKLSGILEKALEVRPEDRFQSSEDFKRALINSTRGSTRRRVVSGSLALKPPPSLDHSELPVWGLQPALTDPGQELPIPVSRELLPNEAIQHPRRRLNPGILALVLLMGLVVGMCSGFYFFLPNLSSSALAAFLPQFSAGAVGLIPPSPTVALSTRPAALTPTPVPSATATNVPKPTSTPTMIEEGLANPGDIRQLEPPPPATYTPTPTATPLGGGGSQIAFASDRTGIPQIWLSDLSGANLHQLTDIPEGACQPDWSPDGSQLVFISPCDRNKEGYQTASLFLINADGSNLRLLPTILGGDYDPAWSPDGKTIAFTSLRDEGRPQIFFLHLDDMSIEPMTEEITNDFMPSWSPDGTKLLFVTTRRGPFQIWFTDLEGEVQQLYSRSGGEKNTSPRMSPNGQVIIFNRVKQEPGVPTLMGTRVENDTYQEFLIFQNWIPSRDADFSPDGVWITFESWPDGQNHDIYIMTHNGVNLQRLTADPADDFDPAWRPLLPTN